MSQAGKTVTCTVHITAPQWPEDNAGDDDESSNQQEGPQIEDHQESEKQEVRQDTAAKVPCGVKFFTLAQNAKYYIVLYIFGSVYVRGNSQSIEMNVYLQSFVRICSKVW